ncbi:hypothetical protein ACEQ8H_006206 [Pleosporales sp. CAS-2024a]
MDASLATYQARLATFQGAPAAKTRRTSSRSKKTAPKAKAAWPLAAPTPEDLAYAGFVWKPTTVSLDNVQCWACNCQLDGWEEADVPAFEHLTHAPGCGVAVVATIRLRHGDPGRIEEDPISQQMIKARKDTFGDLWPLDPGAGFPSVDQLAEAGWFYDPTEETPDGTTCAYCHLSLDAWDAGDDPLEEHRRRQSDCLFFVLNDLYHPVAPEPKKTKRVTKGKRASSRSSVASVATTATAPKKKATRGKKRASEAIDDTQMAAAPAIPLAPAPKKRGKKSASEAVDDTQVSEANTRGTRGRKHASEAIDDTQLSKATTRGRKGASESVDDTQLSKATTRGKKRASETMDNSQISKATTRGKKRTSEVLEDDTRSEANDDAPKRMRFSSISSFPDDLDVGTPKNQPTDMVTEPFTMSSLPGDLLAGTPKRTPAHLREAVVNRTPSPKQTDEDKMAWQPTDLEAFFGNQENLHGFFNGVKVDAGLDALNVAGSTPKDIQAAVLAALTDSEKEMTVEQWVMYNAQRGEEKLRKACERQIAAFRAEGQRALAQLAAVSSY